MWWWQRGSLKEVLVRRGENSYWRWCSSTFTNDLCTISGLVEWQCSGHHLDQFSIVGWLIDLTSAQPKGVVQLRLTSATLPVFEWGKQYLQCYFECTQSRTVNHVLNLVESTGVSVIGYFIRVATAIWCCICFSGNRRKHWQVRLLRRSAQVRSINHRWASSVTSYSIHGCSINGGTERTLQRLALRQGVKSCSGCDTNNLTCFIKGCTETLGCTEWT